MKTQKEQWLELMGNFRNTYVEDTPNFIVISRLFYKLKEKFTNEESAKIVGSIKINVSREFVNDPELMKTTIDSFYAIVVDLYFACETVHPSLFWEMLKSQEFTLNYN